MLGGAAESARRNSLLAAYSLRLAKSTLRRRACLAERFARIENQLAGNRKTEFVAKFLANMSQELRSPLNTVIGIANLLLEQQRRPLHDVDIVAHGERIRDRATHLLCVINDILDISRMQNDAFTLDTREVELGEILQVALASLRPTAFEAGVALEGHFDKDLPTIEGDAGKLRKVFASLIGNAVRFTPWGGAVRVEGRRRQDSGVAVRVRDTGLGMTEEEIAAALAPFARSGHARWREGTGLGLPIAQALVQLHGGSLQIKSSKAHGTEVKVILPSRPPALSAERRDRAAAGRAGGR
jgi:two-component system, cell cycle sensor histidine kinase PleC